MVLVRPAPEEPPRVAVDAGQMHGPLKIGESLVHQRDGIRRQSLEGRVDAVLEFLLVGEEPGPLIMEGELPEERAGFFGEACEHGKSVFQ